MRTRYNRRTLFQGTAATLVAAASGAESAGGVKSSAALGPKRAQSEPVKLTDTQLLAAFVKLRASIDSRLTIGWVDAVNYGFIEGETFPLYRLLAATWQVFEQRSDSLFEGRLIEIAHFVDMHSGELLRELTMPRTNQVVEVPHYRAGPTVTKVAVQLDEKREFAMNPGVTGDPKFFRAGVAIASQHLSQAEHEGNTFRVRQDVGTRVVPADPAARGFFYREWTIWSGNWTDIQNPAVHSAPTELNYSSAAAWRPWMKMEGVTGNTLQSGRGGKAQRTEDLPSEHLRLTQQIHPDLLDDPLKLLRAAG